MSRSATAALVVEPRAPFRLGQVSIDEPREGELLVRIVAAGLCHTDLTAQAGLLPFSMPAVLGHEGAGVVEAVGSGVAGVRVGDKVLLSFTSCGRCRSCRAGAPALCEAWLPLNLLAGRRADGSVTIRGADGRDVSGHFFGQSSLSTLALVDARSAVRVDPDAPLELLAPLGCGIQTGVGTVLEVLRPSPGSSVAVVGAGAVGLSAVMACALTPATTVIAVDRVPARLSLARELGATHTIDVNGAALADALRDATGGRGVDFALDTTADVGTIGATLSALAVGGTLALVGAPPFGTQVPVEVNWMLCGRRLVGVTEGCVDPQAFLPTLIRLHAEGRLPIERLLRTYRFAEIQAAAEDLAAGRTIKPVLLFDP